MNGVADLGLKVVRLSPPATHSEDILGGFFVRDIYESRISWTEVDFVTVYPRNAVFSWTESHKACGAGPLLQLAQPAMRSRLAYLPAQVPCTTI